jgi:hypothetical protein
MRFKVKSELRDDRGNRDGRYRLEVEPREREEVARVHAVLVNRPRALRRQTPVPRQTLVLEHAERRVRVPHIHHGSIRL